MAKLRKSRATKLTPELQRLLIAAAKKNPSLVDLANLAKVSERTLHYWREKGRDGHPDFVDWYVDFEAARGTLKNELVENLRQAGSLIEKPHSARANEYLLEKFYPTEFGSRARTTINVQQNIGQQVNMKELSTEKLDALLGEIEALEADIVDAEVIEDEDE